MTVTNILHAAGIGMSVGGIITKMVNEQGWGFFLSKMHATLKEKLAVYTMFVSQTYFNDSPLY